LTLHCGPCGDASQEIAAAVEPARGEWAVGPRCGRVIWLLSATGHYPGAAFGCSKHAPFVAAAGASVFACGCGCGCGCVGMCVCMSE
jgi:hypothetical protein